MNELENIEFTNDGYIISNDCYFGIKKDDSLDWDWYDDITLAREMLNPIINMNIIKDIKDYIVFVNND